MFSRAFAEVMHYFAIDSGEEKLYTPTAPQDVIGDDH
jgi:hypothetical protein